jgi:hypothetical protein
VTTQSIDPTGFLHEPDPDHPGWMRWGFRDPTRFNSLLGDMIVRVEDDGRVRMRGFPERRQGAWRRAARLY